MVLGDDTADDTDPNEQPPQYVPEFMKDRMKLNEIAQRFVMMGCTLPKWAREDIEHLFKVIRDE